MNKTGVILAITFFFFGVVPAHAEFVSSPVTRTDDGLYRNVTPALVNASSLGVVSPITKGVYGGQTAFKLDGRLDKDANGALSYAGYSDSFTNNIGWDAGVSLYHSDDQRLNDFAEVYGGLSYKVFRTRFALANDYFGTHGYRALLEAGMAMNFGDGFGIGVHVGRSSFDNRTGLKGFTGYRINLSREVEGFDLGVNFTHSGYDAVRLSEENYSGSALEDSAFNFTITRDF